jgi:hypothetical protein
MPVSGEVRKGSARSWRAGFFVVPLLVGNHPVLPGCGFFATLHFVLFSKEKIYIVHFSMRKESNHNVSHSIHSSSTEEAQVFSFLHLKINQFSQGNEAKKCLFLFLLI